MKKKRKIAWWNGLYWGLFALLLLAARSIGRRYLMLSGAEPSGLLNLLGLLGFALAYFLQMFLECAGRLLFGLLSGYQFILFRVFSFVWVSDGKKVRLMRDPTVGGAFVCTMAPPVSENGAMPVALYWLGGVLTQMITASASMLGAWLFRGIPMLSTWLLFFAAAGFYFVLINGIPMRDGIFSNEGYSAYYLHKNSDARRAFWILTERVRLMAQGVRKKDMPADWFPMPTMEQMRYKMVAQVTLGICDYLMDQHRFGEMERLLQKLWEMDCEPVRLDWLRLYSDQIYCELMGQNRETVLKPFLERYPIAEESDRKTPAIVLRTKYAYALLHEKDVAAAEKQARALEKLAKNDPYTGEIARERELMALAMQRAKEKGVL